MAKWQVQDAKARFSEFLQTTLEQGPQVVTRRGREAAVLVPIAQWQSLQSGPPGGIKELLLGDGPRWQNLTPARGRLRRRTKVRSQ